MSYGEHKGPIVAGGWDGEYCQECGNNVYFTDICVRGSENWTEGRRQKHLAWNAWEQRARREFEEYWAKYGGI